MMLMLAVIVIADQVGESLDGDLRGIFNLSLASLFWQSALIFGLTSLQLLEVAGFDILNNFEIS